MVTEQQGLVVGDQLTAKAEHEQQDEQPQRIPATTVTPKALQLAPAHGAQVEHHWLLASKSMRGSTKV
ncbi:hypothetical protein D3C71_2172190 [compost metagenome]